jgi:hypothetical protein
MKAKEYYRKMHPELFSDSEVIKINILTRELFSFYLDNLTSENKESAFEVFCKKMIESSICPNLLPHTGPSGGGDSKTDSETIPVSEHFAENWLFGYGDKAHNERRAFAFSAKKDWKPKAISDVKKIAATNTSKGREYCKIFFVSNQPISDKKRSECEDLLRDELSIDVRILDRTWLLDITFTADNVNIAVESFKMSDSYKTEVEVGAKDKERKNRLSAIEKELAKGNDLKNSARISYLKEAVELSRELEVDYTVILGVMERNVMQNIQYGTNQTLAAAYYDYCWTVYWWYGDISLYYEKYKELEALFLNNPNDYSMLRDLSVLWINLWTKVKSDELKIEKFEIHTELICISFERFINDLENPNRAIVARFDYQLIRFQLSENWEDILSEYSFVLDNMDYITDIDLRTMKRILELPILKNSSGYDDVFEKLITKISKMSTEISAASLLLNRGDDYTDEDPYQAIKYFSRAISMLYHESSKTELIQTYLRLGFVFRKIGLLWASRSYYIRAFMSSLTACFNDGLPSPGLFLAAHDLKYLELQLGRLEYSLHFNELENLGRSIYPYDAEIKDDELHRYDLWLAMAVLKEDYSSTHRYGVLPDYLHEYSLIWSSAVLKHKLGYVDEDFLHAMGGMSEFEKVIHDMIQHDEFDAIPHLRDLYEDPIVMISKVIGCDIICVSPRIGVVLEFAASLLSMAENMFATSFSDGVYPFTSSLNIKIEILESENRNVSVIYSTNNITIRLSRIVELFSFEHKQLIADKMFDIVIHFASIILGRNDDIEKMKIAFESENAMFRVTAISSTLDSFLTEGTNYFELPEATQQYKEYPLIRTQEIESIEKSTNVVEPECPPSIQLDPVEMDFKLSDIKHTNIYTSDIINVRLWDKASWKGIACILSPNQQFEPIMAFIFDNTACYSIFEEWIQKKVASRIAIGIIKGIERKNPLWYRVVVAEDSHLSLQKSSEQSVVVIPRRLHTMEAKTDNNVRILEGILQSSESVRVLPVLTRDIQKLHPNINSKHHIRIATKQIEMKNADEIVNTDIFLANGLMPFDDILKRNQSKCFADDVIAHLRDLGERK